MRAENALKRWFKFTGKMFAPYMKSGSLNPFPVTNLRPEVELMYLLRMRRYYRHKSRRKRCREPEMTATL